jgi:hypothetical protein
LCRYWKDRSSAGCGPSGGGSLRFYRSTRSDQFCACVCVCVWAVQKLLVLLRVVNES